MRALLLALLVLLAPLPAAAQGFGVRVTPRGLETLTEIARSRVPSEVSIPAMDRALYDCPGSSVISAEIPDTSIALGMDALDLRTEDGRLFLSTMIEVSVATPITLHNPYACFGTAMCDTSASVRRLAAEVELAAGTSPDGGIAFHGASVNIDLRPDDITVDSSGCAVGEVATWLFEAVKGWALDLLVPRLESLLSSTISSALTDALASAANLSVERDGFRIEASLDALDLSAALGVTAAGDAHVTWSGSPVFGGEAPATEAPVGEPLPADMEGMFQVAVADRLVTDALYEAWRSGLISRLLADQTQSIALGGEGAAQQIGLPAGTELDISFDLEEPLAATFGRVSTDVAELTMRGLHVTVGVRAPTGADSTIELMADAKVQASVGVDQDLGALTLDVRDVEVERVVIMGGATELVIDGARLRAFVSDTVMPMLSARLAGVPIAPAMHGVLGTFLYVRSVRSAGGWQRAGIDVFLPNAGDVAAPETTLQEPATLLGVGTASFRVTGRDDHTPVALLRYRAWLDGEPLGTGEPSSVRAIRFDATDGEHVLEVAAVDMNGNEDTARARHTFRVDGLPPTLTVHEHPEAIVLAGSVYASWGASDEGGSPVETSWQIRVIREDGSVAVVQEAPFGADRGELDVATSSLDVSELYELEIVARDVAGNLTSETFGFALHPSLAPAAGCSASGAAPGSALPAPFLAFFLVVGGALWLRRR
jgi:hypothetical protein